MSFILVVEPDADSASLIHEALASKGLDVRSVTDPDAALQIAAARAPKLVIVNGDIKQADRLLSSFARRQGGPGSVALVSAKGASAPPTEADELVSKPFTQDDLREAVERCWEAKRGSGGGGRPTGRMQLSSEEIFGDVLAELEQEAGEEWDALSPMSAGHKDEAAPRASAEPASPVEEQAKASPFEVDGDVDALLAGALAELNLGSVTDRHAPQQAGPEEGPASPGEDRLEVDAEDEKVSADAAEEADAVDVVPAPTRDVEVPPVEMATEESTVEALEPLTGMEPEVSDGRGRMVLIVAIVATALIGALLVWFLNSRGAGEPETPAVNAILVGESAPPSTAVAESGALGEDLKSTAAAVEAPADVNQTADSNQPAVANQAADANRIGAPTATDSRRSASSTVGKAPAQVAPSSIVTASSAASKAEAVAENDAAPSPPPVEADSSAGGSVEIDDSQPANGTTSSAAVLNPAAGADLEAESPASVDPASVDQDSVGQASEGRDPEAQLESLSAAAQVAAAGSGPAGDNASPPTMVDMEDTVDPRPTEIPTSTSAAVTGTGDEAAEVDGDAAVKGVTASSSVAAATQPGDLVTAGPGVVPPQIESFAKPRYPEIARRLNREGTVIVRMLVDETGQVVEAKLLKTVLAAFDTAVLRAAKRARFKPATKDGVPVKMWHNIEVRLQADS